MVIPVFAAGLKRRIDQRTPDASLLGTVAAWGLVLVSVALLLGSGLDTQFSLALSDPDVLVPESAAFYTDWVATIPWLWLGAGLSGIALAVAAFRHSAAPRWIGAVSVVLGGLTLIAGAVAAAVHGAASPGPSGCSSSRSGSPSATVAEVTRGARPREVHPRGAYRTAEAAPTVAP